jgi:hypothetical protein
MILHDLLHQLLLLPQNLLDLPRSLVDGSQRVTSDANYNDGTYSLHQSNNESEAA